MSKEKSKDEILNELWVDAMRDKWATETHVTRYSIDQWNWRVNIWLKIDFRRLNKSPRARANSEGSE